MLNVFIVCRTFAGGRETRDYALAKQLRELLSVRGANVYIDEMTNEERNSQEGRRLMDNTVMSADVMLVVCADPRCIQGGYVAYQWKKFLAENGEGELAVYVTRNVTKRDLPEPLSRRFVVTEGSDSERYIVEKIMSLDRNNGSIPSYTARQQRRSYAAGTEDGRTENGNMNYGTDVRGHDLPELPEDLGYQTQPRDDARLKTRENRNEIHENETEPAATRRKFPLWAKILIGAVICTLMVFVVAEGLNSPASDENRKASIVESKEEAAVFSFDVESGTTLEYMAGKLEKTLSEKDGTFSAEKFLELCSDPGTVLNDYSFRSEIPDDADRKYPVEGYVFSGTYDFSINADEETVLRTLLDRTESILTGKTVAVKLEDSDMSLDDAIIMASMLYDVLPEKFNSRIAAVYINRIKSGMPLENERSLRYGLGIDSKTEITDENRKTDNGYNTYLNQGLPAGPVSVIDTNMLVTVLSPDTETIENAGIYYLETDADGEFEFVATYEDYTTKKAQYAANRAAAEQE